MYCYSWVTLHVQLYMQIPYFVSCFQLTDVLLYTTPVAGNQYKLNKMLPLLGMQVCFSCSIPLPIIVCLELSEIYFHMKSFALGLILKRTQHATRKWLYCNDYSQLSLRRTPLGPAPTVLLREVSAYREFRYSNKTEKRYAGTNTRCPSYRGVR